MDYEGSAVDLSEDFTVAASNVITTLAFGKEVIFFFFLISSRTTGNGLQHMVFTNSLAVAEQFSCLCRSLPFHRSSMLC